MARYASWVVDSALVALACFFLAQGANTLLSAWLASPPAGPPTPAAAPPATRPGHDREGILARNLFNSATLAPELAAEAEDLEPTELPLTLLGTAAAEDPALSWAAVEDRDSRETLVLRIGDRIRGQAELKRIERKRIVLLEKGTLRELALEEVAPAALPSTAARVAHPRHAPQPAPPSPPEPPAAAAPGVRSPAEIFRDARILPKYEQGQMVGVQVSAIKPGGLFERMGLQEGDVIRELNGVRIDSPEQSAKIMLELSRAATLTLDVEGSTGPRKLNVSLPEP